MSDAAEPAPVVPDPSSAGTEDPAGDDRARSADLLARTHPDVERFRGTAWLDWLYDHNPVGVAIEKTKDRGGDRIGHVALVPQRWRQGERTGVLLATVNAVTATGSGRALFSGLVARAVRDGVGIPDAIAGYGVTNDASSIPALRRLQAQLVGSLPIRIAVPGLGRGVRTDAVDEDYLASGELDDLADELLARRPDEWTQHWSADTLRWRLSAPDAEYALHRTPDVVAVSGIARARGIRIGVLLKVIPRRGAVATRQVRAVVGAVHRHHRVPAVVYAGFNHLVSVPGMPIPKRLRPAPLKLFVIGGDIAASMLADPELRQRGVDADALTFEAFELLDFDAL